LLETLKEDPMNNPSVYDVLVGNFEASYSRRINIQNRIVYQIYENKK
jgi:Txe/YoeB family toxin of Txe-Axe toxin-antitoxin module